LVVAITLVSFRIQPHLKESFAARPWGYVFPILALAGLVGARHYETAAFGELPAFLCSCLFILGMLTSVAFGVYPLRASFKLRSARSLTVSNAAAPLYGLRVGLVWFIPGCC